MPEAASQTAGASAGLQQLEADDKFKDLMGGFVGTRSDKEKDERKRLLDTFIGEVLRDKDLVVPEDVERTIKAYIAEIDRKLSEQINLVIHHEDFKKLEGTWRGLQHLVYKTETDETLKIKIMNISKKDLSKNLEKFPDTAFDQSPLFKKIYEEEYGIFGGRPFGCFVGDYQWDHSPKDVKTLEGVAKIAAAAHAPFISAADSSLFGMDSWQDLNNPRDITKIFGQKEYMAWQALRDSDDSKYLGLVMPRFLARMPYGTGKNVVPIEEFDFEEDAEGTDHNKYIWSNAAFAMGANITAAFKKYGWCTQIRGRESGGTVADLPAHVFPTTDGDTDVKCPTEIAIPDRREAELAKNGFIPLCYVKNSTDAVFVGAQSLHKPKKYQGKDGEYATANANLSARLPYMFAVCRFAHYLKSMVRDKVGKLMEKNDLQKFLTEWIQNYVIANPEDANEEMKAKRPLSAAEIEVKEVEGNPGYYNAIFRLKPHFQLEGVNISLRLVSKLKQG